MADRLVLLRDATSGLRVELPPGDGVYTPGRAVLKNLAASDSVAPDIGRNGAAVHYYRLTGALTVGAPANPPAADIEGPFRIYLESDGASAVTWAAVYDWGDQSPPDLAAVIPGRFVIVACVALDIGAGLRVAAMLAGRGFVA